MKAKTFFLSILFILLVQANFVSCETPEQEELVEQEVKGVDKTIQRPGSQDE